MKYIVNVKYIFNTPEEAKTSAAMTIHTIFGLQRAPVASGSPARHPLMKAFPA